MAISAGLFRKVQQWSSYGEDEMVYRPFQVDGNPYKAKIFVVGANATPKIEGDSTSENIFIESLIIGSLFEELYGYQFTGQSREYNGMIQFASWAKRELGEHVVLTYVNPLQVDGTDELKRVRNELPDRYERGFQVFRTIIQEFQPKVIVLQGTQTLQQFREQFQEQLIDQFENIHKVQELEEHGVFAQLHMSDGQEPIAVLACRSMSYFGKDGASFAALKEQLQLFV